MKTHLENAQGRLLSTRPELLHAWRQTFNSYEAFAEGRDPFANIYNSMIDNAISGRLMDCDVLLEQCEKRVEIMAKKRLGSDSSKPLQIGLTAANAKMAEKTSSTEVKYRKAQSAYALTVIMGQLDWWMNEHMASILVKKSNLGESQPNGSQCNLREIHAQD